MIGTLKPTKVKFQNPKVISWDTFKGGLNIFARETEIQGNELTDATNLLLTGIGIPAKRWGSTLAFTAAPTFTTPVAYRGVGLSGLEFGSSSIPGVLGTNFFDSSQNTFNYFSGKGLNIIRLPILWERMQPVLGTSLSSTYQSIVNTQLGYAQNAGLQVILDIHNFGERTDYYNGGITELFTESNPSLIYPYADYSQSGNIVLRNYGEGLFGTLANPVSPATGYNISFNMQFNSRDDSFGGEGAMIRPMWQSDNECYQLNCDYADGTWTLQTVLNGVTATLGSGTKAWALSTNYAIAIDINQATYGKINVTVNSSALYTNNSINSSPTLAKGQIGFYPNGMHVQLSDMILNVNGDTSLGGYQSYRIGSTQVPISDFTEFWGLMAQSYVNSKTILGYDLMNEPNNMPVPTHLQTSLLSLATLSQSAGIVTVTTSSAHGYYAGDYANVTGASSASYNGTNLSILSIPTATQFTYSTASGANSFAPGAKYSLSPTNYNTTATVTNMMQQAINTIRTYDTNHYVVAETDSYAGAQSFPSLYGTNPTPWWTDSASKLIYSFHYYFDDDHSGSYAQGFTALNNTNIAGDVTPIMSWAETNNLNLFAGEYGVPAIEDWQVCLSTFLNYCNQYNVWASYWAAGDNYTSITSIQPSGSAPNYTDALQMEIVGSNNYLPHSLTPPTPYVGYLLYPIKDANDNIQILGLTDWGFLVKQTGASYVSITGASFASGYIPQVTQLNDNVYFVNEVQPMLKYDFNKLSSFTPLTLPTGMQITVLSATSGYNTWSWIVSAISGTGETGGAVGLSNEISRATLPLDLTSTLINISWSPLSAASGVLTGYNIYRGDPGNEAYVAGVPATTTTWTDTGLNTSSVVQAASSQLVPTQNTTGGLSGKYIIHYQDRLIVSGIPGSPTRIQIGGTASANNNQERFDLFAGGTFVDVDPDTGEDITGIGVYYRIQDSTQTVVAFKEKSVWEVAITTASESNAAVASLSVTVPTYRLLTQSQGCTSHRSIQAVENDLMFLNRRGLYMLRYEPNLFNVINADELSVKVRPFFLDLDPADLYGANAIYADKKYVITFPTTSQGMCFDRERLAFTGPWKMPFGITQWGLYIDNAGDETWLAMDSTDNQVHQFSQTLPDDSGMGIATSLKTRKEDFGDWTLFKNLSEVYFNFANMQGNTQVNVYIEDRTGTVTTAKSFTVQGASSIGTSGMGTDEVGDFELGISGAAGVNFPGELQKVAVIYQTTRTVQVQITTTNSADYYNLLNIKSVATLQARGNRPSTWVE